MKIYILVTNDEGSPSLNMPVKFGRSIRAYDSKARAKVYARRFNCSAVEVDITEGKLLWSEETIKNDI